MRIAQIGTFEVQNYGDNLFPAILKNELSKRILGVGIDFWGPYGGSLSIGNDIFEIKPLIKTSLSKMLQNYEVVIIGGGDLIRPDDERVNEHYRISVGDGYRKNFKPVRSMLVYRPWWRRSQRPFICWNGVGVINVDSEIVRRCASVDYISVRDENSKSILVKAGVSKAVKVIPDTALLIREVCQEQGLPGVSHGIKTDKKILGFQCMDKFAKGKVSNEKIVDILLSLGHKYNLDILLVPIGVCHGDLEFSKELVKLSKGKFLLLENQTSTIDILGLLRRCHFFVGSSLHGNITAASFGIPHLAINTLRFSKISGFFKMLEAGEYSFENWENFEGSLDNLLQQESYFAEDKVRFLKNELCRHFDLIADLVRSNER